MSEAISVTIDQASGVKCPRCWNYHPVRKNFMDMCDRCMKNVLEGLPDWVANGQLTEAEAGELKAGILASVNQWKRAN